MKNSTIFKLITGRKVNHQCYLNLLAYYESVCLDKEIEALGYVRHIFLDCTEWSEFDILSALVCFDCIALLYRQTTASLNQI